MSASTMAPSRASSRASGRRASIRKRRNSTSGMRRWCAGRAGGEPSELVICTSSVWMAEPDAGQLDAGPHARLGEDVAQATGSVGSDVRSRCPRQRDAVVFRSGPLVGSAQPRRVVDQGGLGEPPGDSDS